MLTCDVRPAEQALTHAAPSSHPFARLLGWADWASPARHGFAHTHLPRHGGIGVHAPTTLLGLRAWRDTWEFTDAHRTCVIFELEKFLRMLLRQSTLAAEILCALPPHDDLPITRLLEGALTSQIATAYAQSTRATREALCTHPERVTPSEAKLALRAMLTGAILATQRHMSTHLPTLLARWDDGALTQCVAALDDGELATLEALRDHLDQILPVLDRDSSRNCLPDAPTGYDVLHEFLITQRLASHTTS